MKHFTPTILFNFILLSIIVLGCRKDDDSKNNQENSCFVQLFDGNNYTDDNIIIKGPGEYPNLKALPGADKDWDDEADSFKSGKNTTVTFWPEPDFKGSPVTYKNGAEQPSIDEPRSMKISCD